MGDVIECPKHNGRFDYTSGKALGAPVLVDLRTYPTKVIDGSLFQVGQGLQAAIDLPREVAREPITEALGRLDDTISEIRDYVFTTGGGGAPPADPAPPSGLA
jgi:hypothetical protein